MPDNTNSAIIEAFEAVSTNSSAADPVPGAPPIDAFPAAANVMTNVPAVAGPPALAPSESLLEAEVNMLTPEVVVQYFRSNPPPAVANPVVPGRYVPFLPPAQPSSGSSEAIYKVQ